MLGIGESKPVAGRAEDVIACPIAKAYDFIGKDFFENYPKWCPQVIELEQLSPPPVREGSKGRQVTRDRGIDSESRFEVSCFALQKSFEIVGVTEPFRSSYAFEKEDDESTRIVFTFELKEIDLVMRPFQKLIRTALEEGAIQTIENLKQLLEQAVTETASVPAQ
ncbi:MAG: SRPBCC family protein [Methylocystis sp.]|uniref:SRPBCC family protein n=1 Tax=Methylocystis sp. TaxID=1911079 RepID=UPI003DA5D0D3